MKTPTSACRPDSAPARADRGAALCQPWAQGQHLKAAYARGAVVTHRPHQQSMQVELAVEVLAAHIHQQQWRVQPAALEVATTSQQ